MRINLIVVDDFYDDPEKIRELALRGDYVKPDWRPAILQAQEYIPPQKGMPPILRRIGKLAGVEKPVPVGESGFFRLVTARNFKDQLDTERLIHTDNYDWIGFVCLSLPKTCKGSVSLYRYKKTGVSVLKSQSDWTPEVSRDTAKFEKWDQVMHVDYKYNRLVIFNPLQYHAATAGWGKDKRDGKLIQMFLFNEGGKSEKKAPKKRA